MIHPSKSFKYNINIYMESSLLIKKEVVYKKQFPIIYSIYRLISFFDLIDYL